MPCWHKVGVAQAYLQGLPLIQAVLCFLAAGYKRMFGTLKRLGVSRDWSTGKKVGPGKNAAVVKGRGKWVDLCLEGIFFLG